MITAGVDLGKEGAVTVLDTDTGRLEILDLPLDGDRDLDARRFFDWLSERKPERLVMEACWRPETLVQMKGEVAACCKLLGLRPEQVAVVTWKQQMLGTNTNDKQRSIQKCKELAPQANLVRPRGRTENADRAESVLLALYAANRRSPLPASSSPGPATGGSSQRQP